MKPRSTPQTRFRSTLERLTHNRTLFLSVLSQFEAFPRYLEALEWLGRNDDATLTRLNAPSELAASILLSYFTVLPVSERERRFSTPEADAIDECLDDWNSKRSDERAAANYRLMWTLARQSFSHREQWVANEVERAVRRSRLESEDQDLALFSLGLVFLLAARTASDSWQVVEAAMHLTRREIRSGHFQQRS